MKKIPGYLISICLMISILCFIGWVADIDMLKHPYDGVPNMNPFTALCFIISSITFFLLYDSRIIRFRFPLAPVLMIAILSLASLRLLTFVGINLGVDHWVFKDRIAADISLGHINRMASITAVGFLLIGISMLFSPLRVKWAETLVGNASLLLFAIGLFAIIGYAYHIKEYYGIISYIPMSFTSAVCFVCFSLGLLLENRNIGFMAVISSRNTGGRITRSLVPAILFIPFFLGYLLLFLSGQVYFSVELEIAVLVTMTSIMLLTITWRTAVPLNLSDDHRYDMEQHLIYEARLMNISPVAMVYGHSDLSVSYLNAAAEDLFETTLPENKRVFLADLVDIDISNDRRDEIRAILWGDAGYWQGEMGFVTHTGRKINLLANLKSIKDEKGFNTGWIGVYTDISSLAGRDSETIT
jgi:hypothetical protein